MRNGKRVAAVIAIGVGMVFAACGGGDDDQDPAATLGTTGELGAAVSSADCAEFAESTSTSNTQAAGTVPDFNDLADALERGKSQIPSDLDDDADVVIQAYRKVASDLSTAGLEAGTTVNAGNAAQMGTALRALSTSDVQKSATNLAAWTGRGCK